MSDDDDDESNSVLYLEAGPKSIQAYEAQPCL